MCCILITFLNNCFLSYDFDDNTEKQTKSPEDTCLHEAFEHFCDFIVFFLPYRLWVEFAFATDSRPFLLLFQYVRALFEWGQPLPIRPGASLTSADLIESTTWVKLKQAETALPWQPHYSTLRTHFTMHFDFGFDKWWKGRKSNKWVHFGWLLLKCSGWKYYSTVHILR